MSNEQKKKTEDEVMTLLSTITLKLRRLVQKNPDILKQLDEEPDPAYEEWAAAYYRGEGDVQEIAKRLDAESGDGDDFWQQRAEIADMMSELLKRRPLDLPDANN